MSMGIRSRFLLGFLVIFATGFYFLADFIANEIRPRYLETVEESMIDTAHLLASLLETRIKDNRIDTTDLRSMFTAAFRKKFSARIYAFRKSGIQINVYVTDHRGIVLYDSRDGRDVGKDYSRWNDVYNTLRGKYGARSTRLDPQDSSSSSLYVAAPVTHRSRIIGVLTVVKPEQSVSMFMDLARKKIITALILLCLVFILLSVALSMWINRPIMQLTRYIKSLKEQKRAALPRLSGKEIRLLGESFEDMKNELEGRKYTEHYVQTLTHELKSPLSSIIASAELLTEDMDVNQQIRFAGTILHEARRILKLINRLLQLSSLENRRELRDVQDVHALPLLEEILASLEPIIKKGGQSIVLDIDRSHILRGERFLIFHSLMNILSNAVNFSPHGGTITVTSSRRGSFLDISVIDEGTGIPDYAMNKIFDKFYSLPDPDNRKKGTGLGLSFVKEALSLHNGKIIIYNNDDRGVTVLASFPTSN